MAGFDFIEASAKGYELSWYERSYLMRALVPVFLVKLACILVIRFMNIVEHSLLMGLIAMPAHVLEAIIMVSVVRFVAFNEPLFEFRRVMGGGTDVSQSHFPDKGSSVNIAAKRLQSASGYSGEQMFKAGVAMYLLIKVVELGFLGVIQDYSKMLDPDVPAQMPEQNLVSAMVFMAIAGVMLWSVRLLWLYIPLAMGCSVRGFLVRISGMMSSLSMFATSFVCCLPPLVLLSGVLVMSSFVLVPESLLQVLVHDMIRVFGETVIILLQVVAMTFGFIEILTQQKKKS